MLRLSASLARGLARPHVESRAYIKGFRGNKPKTKAERLADNVPQRSWRDTAPGVMETHENPYNVTLPEPDPTAEKPVFAIVRLGSTQYKIAKGDVIVADKVRHLDIDEKIVISEVLLLGTMHETMVGRPLVEDAMVVLHCQEQTKDKKLVVFKKRRRKNSSTKNGHRRKVTLLRVEDIICKELGVGGEPPVHGIPMMTMAEEEVLLDDYGKSEMRHIKRSPPGTVENDPRVVLRPPKAVFSADDWANNHEEAGDDGDEDDDDDDDEEEDEEEEGDDEEEKEEEPEKK